MKQSRLYLLFLLLSLTVGSLQAQKNVRKYTRQGNTSYVKKEYDSAEISYRKALEEDASNVFATYNLSNVLYRTDRMEEATKLLSTLLEKKDLPSQSRSDVAHNLGNTWMKAKKYSQAIEAYKESLRHRPGDEGTRYNLALAQKLLEKEQQDKKNQPEENKHNDQEKPEEKPSDSPKDDQKKEDSNKDDKPQESQESREKMSRDNAQKILDAFLRDEKDTKEKVEKLKQLKSNSRPQEKNW